MERRWIVALGCSLALSVQQSWRASQAHAQQPDEPLPEVADPAKDPAAPGADDAAVETNEAAGVVAPPPPEAEVSPTPQGGTAVPDTADDHTEASAGGLFEQSQQEGAASETRSHARRFDLNGYVRGDVFVGKMRGARRAEIKAAYGELALKLQVKKELYGDAYAEARLRYGQQGDVRDLFIDLREAYVNVYVGPVDIRLGNQIIVWGRADAFNPTNNLTPIDLRIRSPLEDDRRVANVGARAFLNLTPVRIEGVWMPLYAPVELPPIALPEFVVLADPRFPAPELENGLGAVRVHLELPAFEASASYLYGHAPLPGLTLNDFTVGVDPPEVRISRTAYDHHVVGLDFSSTIGELVATRAEAAYRHPVDYENRIQAPRPDLHYVFGLDRAFGSVNVIAQYMGRYVFDWRPETGPEDPIEPTALSGFMPPLPAFLEQSIIDSINADLTERNQTLFSQKARVQHLSSVRIEWLTLHDTLSLSALGMVNFTTKEWVFYPRAGYKISDVLSAYVGAEIYSGPDGTLFDLIEQELSAGYTELRASF
jgi:hypothetical protein